MFSFSLQNANLRVLRDVVARTRVFSYGGYNATWPYSNPESGMLLSIETNTSIYAWCLAHELVCDRHR